MQIEMMLSKIHRATVTDANLNYVGSITVDSLLMEKAHILENQKVDIVNINNGERFSTYVIPGAAGRGDICLNGAAARKVAIGDKVIIMAYAYMDEQEAACHKPTVVQMGEGNRIIEKAPISGVA